MSEIPKNQSLNTQLANAVADVAAAQDRLCRMSAEAERAHREECAAMNAVNEAQKRFDALVSEVKKSAPRNSDWRRPVGVPVTA